MSKHSFGTVVLETPYGVEIVSPGRARVLALGANAVVTRARDGRIVRVQLRQFVTEGDGIAAPFGNGAQRLIHRHESATNPPHVWEHKRGAYWRGGG